MQIQLPGYSPKARSRISSPYFNPVKAILQSFQRSRRRTNFSRLSRQIMVYYYRFVLQSYIGFFHDAGLSQLLCIDQRRSHLNDSLRRGHFQVNLFALCYNSYLGICIIAELAFSNLRDSAPPRYTFPSAYTGCFV